MPFEQLFLDDPLFLFSFLPFLLSVCLTFSFYMQLKKVPWGPFNNIEHSRGKSIDQPISCFECIVLRPHYGLNLLKSRDEALLWLIDLILPWFHVSCCKYHMLVLRGSRKIILGNYRVAFAHLDHWIAPQDNLKNQRKYKDFNEFQIMIDFYSFLKTSGICFYNQHCNSLHN